MHIWIILELNNFLHVANRLLLWIKIVLSDLLQRDVGIILKLIEVLILALVKFIKFVIIYKVVPLNQLK